VAGAGRAGVPEAAYELSFVELAGRLLLAEGAGALVCFRVVVHGASFAGFGRWCQAGWCSVVVEGPDRAG
jgi:hypothetical protein